MDLQIPQIFEMNGDKGKSALEQEAQFHLCAEELTPFAHISFVAALSFR